MVILAISPSKDIRYGLHDEEAYVAHVDPEPPLQKLVSFLLSSSLIVGGAKKPKVRILMGALWIPISLVLGCSEQFSESP